MIAKFITSKDQLRDRALFDACPTVQSPLVAFLQSEANSIVTNAAHPVRLAFEQLALSDLTAEEIPLLSSHQLSLRKKSVVAFFATPSTIGFFDLSLSDSRNRFYGFYRRDPAYQDTVFLNSFFLNALHHISRLDLARQPFVLSKLLEIVRAKWLHELSHRFIYQVGAHSLYLEVHSAHFNASQNMVLEGSRVANAERFDVMRPAFDQAAESAGYGHSGRWLELELFGGYLEIGNDQVDGTFAMDSYIDILTHQSFFQISTLYSRLGIQTQTAFESTALMRLRYWIGSVNLL